MQNVIHSIDYSLWRQDKAAFAKQLGASFANTGFAVVRGHTLKTDVVETGLETAKRFFALPDDIKSVYQRPEIGFQRGYSPLGTENAKGRNQGDLKEFWHIGRPSWTKTLSQHSETLCHTNANSPTSAQHLSRGEEVLQTPCVPDVDGFDGAMRDLYTEFDAFGAQILRAVALYLDLEETWFDAPVEDGNSLLRLLHYPPQLGERVDGAVRAGAHEDINLITLLLGAQEAGLEVKHGTHGWLRLDVPEGAIVLNCGDMLQRLTGGILPSVTHRVTNPRPERAHLGRYSMPFFLHPKNSFVLETLPSCIERGATVQPPICAGDYLRERLIDIGLLSAA